MKYCRILNSKTGDEIISKGRIASNPWELMVGMLGEKSNCMPLILPNTNLIHTVGMRFPIDLCFFDEDWVCLRWIKNLTPSKLGWGPIKTKYVLETKTDINSVVDDIPIGCQIKIEPL